MLFRKFFAGCFTVLAVVLTCAAIVVAVQWGSWIEHTVQNAREIEKSFSVASAFVDGFSQSHGRLPSEAEFSAWAAIQSEKVHSARHFQFVTSPSQFPHEIVGKFGKPPESSYILQYWRGEWFEYYASWVKASTLELNQSSFYFLGSSIADGIALLVIGLLVAVVARAVRPPPNQSFHRTYAKSRAGR